MKPFIEYIKESVVDIPRANLDPSVFQFPDDDTPPFLNPSIKRQILMDMDNFSDLVQIKRFYIVGSILTKFYSENSDIDVTIEMFKDDVDDSAQAKLLEIIKRLNGKLASHTSHPINYFVVLGDVNEENFDAMYDVINDKWLKVPENVETNIAEYLHNFSKVVSKIDLTIAQLKRDIIDYDTLAKFSDTEIHNLQNVLSRKLYEISDKVETLIDIKNTIHRQRKTAFKRPMSPEEIQRYKDKNHLPENIIQKLLQKYYYWDFIQKLDKIVGGKEELSPDDLNKIKELGKDDCIKNFESFANADDKKVITEIRKVKLKKINWKDPQSHTKSFLHKLNRSFNRKSLVQVPVSQRIDKRSMMSGGVGSAKKNLDIAKRSPSGIWRVTPQQMLWISNKYHFIPPNAQKHVKHLGNTGIMLWRKAHGKYYLVKTSLPS